MTVDQYIERHLRDRKAYIIHSVDISNVPAEAEDDFYPYFVIQNQEEQDNVNEPG